MFTVTSDQSIIEITRLLLQSSAPAVRYVHCVTGSEQELSSDLFLNLFAAGFSAEAPLGDLHSSDPEQNPLWFAIRWFISVFDALHDGVLIADQNEIVRYINRSFERISGAKFEETVGRVLVEARPGARLGGVIRSGKPLLGVRRQFGEIEYMTDMHPIIMNGRCLGGVTIARDITEIQQLQTKLSKYRVRYSDLLRQMNKDAVASYSFSDIRGVSRCLQETKLLAEKLSKSDLPVLIRGESGTGKELFAQAIHRASNRRSQPFVTVNCAAIPGPLLESELFGYHEGAFSGARQSGKPGLITLAHKGTLFLDEIGDMNLDLQAKMLRVLQTGEVQPLGSLNKLQLDVRVIAATNRSLEDMIAAGKYRSDLFYRLNVSQVLIPPLRQRSEDIAPLARYFLDQSVHSAFGRLELDPQTLEILKHYPWPGNVRELENTIRFIANITDGRVITPNYLPQVFFQYQPHPSGQETSGDNPAAPVCLKAANAAAEKDLIIAALSRCGHNVRGKRLAASQLGISLTTLYSRMHRYGLR